MKKPRKSNGPKLPPAPTGYEIIDLEWAALGPKAGVLLKELPANVHKDWGTRYGALAYLLVRHKVSVATAELTRTRSPTLIRIRERNLRLDELAFSNCGCSIAAAVAQRAQREYPAALPSQVLLLVRDRCKLLFRQAFRHHPWLAAY